MGRILLKSLAITAVLILVGVVFYKIGCAAGESAAYDEDRDNVYQWISMEKKFLKDFLGDEETPELKSGVYEFTIHMSGMPPTQGQVELTFKDGRLQVADNKTMRYNYRMEDMKIEGQAVTWCDAGMLYSYDADFVGVIREGMMWGHVFVVGNEDETSIGLWKLLPVKSPKTK